MLNATKCAHPACECTVAPKSEFGKYCGDECRRAGQITELRCSCRHAECREAGVSTSNAPPAHARRV